ncbi:MAG: TraX family protein [Oscillospiraceae bacterium]|nr:TraX family protein [Oscillospiraceae bacterium]
MSSFALKITALLLMLLDHIYQFFAFTGMIPIWFTWIGRLSAPIFYFCMAQGLAYTHSRKIYLARMYLFSVVMASGNLLLTAILPGAPSGDIPNNIFGSLLLGAVIIVCMEQMAKDRQKGQLLWMYFLGFELASFFIGDMLTRAGQTVAAQILRILVPTPLTVEGGVFFVLLGPLFYYFRLSKKKTAMMYLVFSLGLCLTSSIAWYALGMSVWDAFFRVQYQWMMVFALPFFWCYNGKKGKYSLKYLFYLFYPLHIWALYALSTLLPA